MEEGSDQFVLGIMNWEKLKINHIFENPVRHIYASTLFDIKEYDKLLDLAKDIYDNFFKRFQ